MDRSARDERARPDAPIRTDDVNRVADANGTDDRTASNRTETNRIETNQAARTPGKTGAASAAPGANADANVGLLGGSDLDGFRREWEQVQIAFVDEPRRAVQQAHDLVDQVVDRLVRTFSEQRDQLEGTWSRGGDVDTEALRLALQRYRSFFNRLLST